MSSVFGLNVTPSIETFLFLILFNKIELILFINKLFRLVLDLTTDLIIERFVLYKSPVTVIASVSFGKHDPP